MYKYMYIICILVRLADLQEDLQTCKRTCRLARGLADLQGDLQTCKGTCRLARGLADLQETCKGRLLSIFRFFVFDIGSIWDQFGINPRSICISPISVSTDFVFFNISIIFICFDLFQNSSKNSLSEAFCKLGRLK